MRTEAATTHSAFCVVVLALILALPAFLPAEGKKHSVDLSWQPAKGHMVGYNIYRGVKKGGPYVKIASKVARPPYRDIAVDSHRTYYYVVTSVDKRGLESADSKEVKAKVP
ncbi:MAG TPA: hypothetical protein VLW84_09540 [Terriglobales bacterium]|nr:hypothetical protein [Terriglobales bacterium]